MSYAAAAAAPTAIITPPLAQPFLPKRETSNTKHEPLIQMPILSCSLACGCFFFSTLKLNTPYSSKMPSIPPLQEKKKKKNKH